MKRNEGNITRITTKRNSNYCVNIQYSSNDTGFNNSMIEDKEMLEIVHNNYKKHQKTANKGRSVVIRKIDLFILYIGLFTLLIGAIRLYLVIRRY